MSIYFLYAPPEPFATTVIDKSFPGHYLPLGNTVHKIGHSIHEFFNPDSNEVSTPRADIRETVDKFYIEVELPGVGMDKDFSLQWTNSRTLLLEAKLKQPEINLQPTSHEAEGIPENGSQHKSKAPQHPIHSIKKERRVGQFARAFDFWVPVNHETMEAKLQFGLLQVVLTKSPEQLMNSKSVTVEDHETS
jgi:HSP20 family molecular chaperone IbpA